MAKTPQSAPVNLRSILDAPFKFRPIGPRADDASRSAEALRVGIALHRADQLDEAAKYYHEALFLDPTSALAWNALGCWRVWRGDLSDAMRAFTQALDWEPDRAGIWSNLALTYWHADCLEDAERAATEALNRAPDPAFFRDQLCLLGHVYMALGRADLAVERYDRAFDTAPTETAAFCRVYARMLRPQTPEEQRRVREEYARLLMRGITPMAVEPADRDPDRPLRVGYLSGNYASHSAAHMWRMILLSHDPKAVVPFAYSTRAAHPEDTHQDDFKREVRHWRDLTALDDERATARILQDELDILVDLMGHTIAHRLGIFARKPAPIQVTGWGYAHSVGLPTIDAFVADDYTVPPEDEPHFVERIERLPCLVSFDPPRESPPEQTEPPCIRFGSLTFGAFGRPEKMTPETLGLYARVLQAVPESRILFKEHGFRLPEVARGIRARLVALGIDGARVQVLPSTTRWHHLAAMRELLDVALGASPHQGAVGLCESLWMGVPSVERTGRTVGERTSASILHALQLDRWIARSDDEYVSIAVNLGRHCLAQRDGEVKRHSWELRERLRNSVLCQPEYVREVEAMYRRLWHRYLGT